MRVATYRDGRWHYASRAEISVSKGYVAPRDRLNRDTEKAASTSPAGQVAAKK